MMFRGILKYFSIVVVLFGIWNLFLGYFPFLLFLLSLLLFFFAVGLSYKSMKTTTVMMDCQHTIIERHDLLNITFLRKDECFVHCGQIIIEYDICDSLGHIICHRKQYLNGEEITDHVRLEHCGAYQLRMIKIYCYDILNCFRYKHEKQDVHIVYVFPTLIHIDAELENAVGLTQESSDYSPYQKGEDYSEIFEIKPYHETDQLKHIHWKASMKKDELFVKVGSQPIIKKILLVVELHQSHGDDDALDRFYSLCLMLFNKQVPFEILCPQVHSDLPMPEYIANQEQLRDCIKRLLKEMKCDYRYALSQSEDYLSLYVVTQQGIEVYEK